MLTDERKGQIALIMIKKGLGEKASKLAREAKDNVIFLSQDMSKAEISGAEARQFLLALINEAILPIC